jgi:hypothetical protein
MAKPLTFSYLTQYLLQLLGREKGLVIELIIKYAYWMKPSLKKEKTTTTTKIPDLESLETCRFANKFMNQYKCT